MSVANTLSAWFHRPVLPRVAIVDPRQHAHARRFTTKQSPSGVPQMAFFTAASKA
ncbi:hypothetical protein, partial [Pseudomonas shirazensis]